MSKTKKTPILDNVIDLLDEAKEAIWRARLSNEIPDRDMTSLIGMMDTVKGVSVVVGMIRRNQQEGR